MYNDLSIIFHGPVISLEKKNYTLEAIESAIENFPGAEIIFSTWEHQKIPSEIKNNVNIKIIFNTDPGSGIRKDEPITYHNVNRIIISSIGGLKNSSRKYCIKTRSDMIFKSSKCLHFLFRYNKFDENFSIFKDRIIVSNQTSINPKYGPKLLYHLCDWFFLGRTDDLLNLYNIKMIDDISEVRWYEANIKPENKIDKNNLSLFMAEDFVISTFFKKYFKIRHDYYCDYDKKEKVFSEKLIVNNFVIVDNLKLGIYSGKYAKLSRAYLWKCYTFQEWEHNYKKYILGISKSILFSERLTLLLLNLNPLHLYRLFKTKFLN